MSYVTFGQAFWTACTLEPPTQRARSRVRGLYAQEVQGLLSDPIGTMTVIFKGVEAGSEIRVIRYDLVELAGIENCVANQSLSWDVYPTGSPYNDVVVKIASLAYKLKAIPLLSESLLLTLPIQQEADKWYSNP